MQIFTYGLVIGIYLIVLLSIGWFIQSKGFQNIREWALEKGQYSAFALALTIFATTYSAFTFIGLPGFYYTHGIGTVLYITATTLTLAPICMYIIGKKVVQLNKDKVCLTPIELLARRLSGKWVKWFVIFSVGFLILFNIPYVVIQIAGIGKVLNGLTAGAVSYEISALLVLVAIFIYVEWGGMKGIIWTDIFQGLFGIFLMTLLTFFFIQSQWGSLGEMFVQLKATLPDHTTLPGPEGKMTPGYIITAYLAVGVLSISFIQNFHRLMLFHSKKHVRDTVLGFVVASGIIGTLALLIGLGAAVAFPGLESGDMAIVEVIKASPLATTFGDFLGAFFFIAVLTGAMSTADSVLFTLGTIFTHDFCGKVLGVKFTQKQEKLIIKTFILVFLVFCYLLSLNPPEMIIDLAMVGLSAVAAVAPAFTAVLFSHKVNSQYVVYSLIGAEMAFVGWQWLGWPTVYGLGAAFWAILVGFVILGMGKLRLAKKA